MLAILRYGLGWVILAMLLNACTSPPRAEPRTARVSEIVNIVDARLAPQSAFAPATLGLTLKTDGQVRTGVVSRARLDFSEGSILRLSENTQLTVQEIDPSDGDPVTRFQLTLGKIWVSVFNRTFELQTPAGVATVRGSFAVFEVVLENPADPSSVRLIVNCLEGDCTAKNDVTSSRFGNLQRVELKRRQPEIVPQPAPPEALADFLSNNREPASQQIVPTLTAIPLRNNPRVPERTATPTSARPTETRALELATRTLEPATRTAEPATSTPRVSIITTTLESRTPITQTLATATPTPIVRSVDSSGVQGIVSPVITTSNTTTTTSNTTIATRAIETPAPSKPTATEAIRILPTLSTNINPFATPIRIIQPTSIRIEPTKSTITTPTPSTEISGQRTPVPTVPK